MEGVPTKNLRCESSVISQDDALGENAAQCGDIAIRCADCGISAGCKQHAVRCNKCGRPVCESCADGHRCTEPATVA
jgi:hypothetical protein